jgi:very-short-patch-repair endonuclease
MFGGTLDEAWAVALPELYPWIEFERCRREDWIKWHGIDRKYIHEKAAKAYLDGEASYFASFDEDFPVALNRPEIKQRTLERIRSEFNNAAVNLCESPIEQILLSSLIWTCYGYESGPVEIWDSTLPFGKPDADVLIAPQYQIGRHRVDFAILINGVANEEIKIVVECDGHDFHEKTKQQAARDKSRDRDLQIDGWKVFRFTGSEIWRDHEKCADHVAKLATNEIETQLRRRGLIK